jgi:hypothetical protein
VIHERVSLEYKKRLDQQRSATEFTKLLPPAAKT